MEGLSGFYEGQQVAVLGKKWLVLTSGSSPVQSGTQVLQHHTSADNLSIPCAVGKSSLY